MLIAVRHGKTSANEDGVERLRGWSPIPLNTEGKHGAIKVADVIKHLNLPFHSFHSSPLKRAIQTAEPIGHEINMSPRVTDSLKDWNVGELTGRDVKDTLPTIHAYMDRPNSVIPGGESYNSFASRTIPFLRNLIESKHTHLVVSHNRVMTLLHAMSKGKGKGIDINHLKQKGPIEPSGILSLDPNYDMDILHHGNVEKGVSGV
jgi:probable phosphoglycerate mutase